MPIEDFFFGGLFFIAEALTYTPKVYIIIGVENMYAFGVYNYSI